MGHIKNLDVRLMTLLAALVGVVALIADGAGRVMFSGGFGRSRGRSNDSSSDSKGGSNPLVILLFVIWIISWILAPLITRLLAMGVSRKREYLADAMSAQFTRNPHGAGERAHEDRERRASRRAASRAARRTSASPIRSDAR